MALGQMTIHPGDVPPLQPDNLVTNVFLGNGVELINSQYYGNEEAVGSFDNAESIIGLKNGIVLSTGHAISVNSKNIEGETISGNTSGSTVVDEALDELAGVKVVDIAKFKLDFKPSSDLLTFRYVFASEEYPNFVCFNNNDVFGFFITGPKPGGGRYEGENIAKIPDPNRPGQFLDLPVTVNSVNGGTPGALSDGGLCDQPNESLEYRQYYNRVDYNAEPVFNAYLDIFTAEALVIPCETYTIEIAIGDGGDQIEDSAVFLEGRSFSTRELIVDINNPGIEGGLAEDCESGAIDISIQQPLDFDLPVELSVLTDSDLVNPATEGEDFVSLPSSFSIKAGTTSISVPLIPMLDNIEEGTEFIYLGLRRNICRVDTFILPLYDNVLQAVSIPDTLMTCANESFTLTADLGDINTADNLEFFSSEPVDILAVNGVAESTINVSGLKDIALNPSIIAEICIDELSHSQLNDLDIYLKAPSGQILELSTDNGVSNSSTGLKNTCFSSTATANINRGSATESEADSANPNYTGSYLPEGSFEEWLMPVTSELNGPYTLFIVDDNKEVDGRLEKWHLTINPKYELDYNWSPSNGIDCPTCTNTLGQITSSQYYYLNLVDSYGCTFIDSTWIEIFPREEQPVATCHPIGEGSIEVSWPLTANATASYEFMVEGKDRWYSTEVARDLVAGLLNVSIIEKNKVTVGGLLTNEELTVYVRAINRAGCNSPEASVSCTAIPCAVLPEIIEVDIQQPECSNQRTTRVSVNAEANSNLSYVIQLDNVSAFNFGGNFGAIPSGTWPLRVIDANGCATQQLITVNEPPKFEMQPVVSDIACRDDNDASIALNLSGDNGPFTIEWNTGSNEETLSNLEAGTYYVEVSDSEDCILVDTFEILNPNELISTYLQTNELNCNGENPDAFATVFSFGGVAPYETTWNNNQVTDTLHNLSSGILEWSVRDSLGCIVSGESEVLQIDGLQVTFDNVTDLSCNNSMEGIATALVENSSGDLEYIWSTGEETATAQQLVAGLNYVTVTDSEGCMAITEVLIEAPTAIEAEVVTEQNPSCAEVTDGMISLLPSGGTGSLEVIWDEGTIGTTLTNIGSGRYCATIYDETNCSIEKCFELTNTALLTADSRITKVSCNPGNDGAIALQPRGGSGNYIYKWTGPNGFTSTMQNIDQLEAGLYILTITDIQNSECTSSQIEFDLTIDSDLSTTLVIENPFTCLGDPNGKIAANVSGGTAPYSYDWSNGEVTSIIDNLSAGAYSVVVTDANQCSVTTELIIDESEMLSISVDKQDLRCPENQDGHINLETVGGIPPYSYEWNVLGNSNSLNGLSAGSYQVTVTDASNCSLIEEIEILERFEAIEVITEVSDEQCYLSQDGQIAVEVLTGTQPFRFALNNGSMQSDNIFSNLSSGDYLLTIMDNNGCMVQQELTVNAAPEIYLEINGDLTIPFGADVMLDTEMRNVNGDVAYIWNAPILDAFSCTDCGAPTISNITESFSASLLVQDELGCSQETFININIVNEVDIAVPTGFSPNGDGKNDFLQVFGNPDFTILSFTVYGRNGQKVYEGENLIPNQSEGWDGNFNGSPSPSGSYVWTIDYIDLAGKKGSARGVTTLIP